MRKQTRLTCLMIALAVGLCVALFSGCGTDPDPLLDNQAMARELERLMDPASASGAGDEFYTSSPNELVEAILRHNEIQVSSVEKTQATYEVKCVITAPDVAAALKSVSRQLQQQDEVTMDDIQNLVLTEIEQAGTISLSADISVAHADGELVPALSDDIIDAYLGGLLRYIDDYDFGQ
ncbi:MAG: hypothetical protein GX112_10780 [Clostridiaceae bacterium]|nr:hypothetical protein [Clostridiaceae bacterium]